ncbi:hypothetical protein [Streptomyces sp. PvR034]|uniref:hypothetical protein n=1 Tax=Streptomyces sp. PvR034 TaxID=3156401 RepID=UPI0033925A9F
MKATTLAGAVIRVEGIRKMKTAAVASTFPGPRLSASFFTGRSVHVDGGCPLHWDVNEQGDRAK